MVRRVGKAQRAHHQNQRWKWWARFALPTLRGRWQLIHLEPDRHLFRAVDKIGLRHLDLAVEGDRFQPRQQFLEQDAHLELGQILPEAEMRAIAERDMTVRLAVAAKLVRLF